MVCPTRRAESDLSTPNIGDCLASDLDACGIGAGVKYATRAFYVILMICMFPFALLFALAYHMLSDVKYYPVDWERTND